MNDVKCKCGRAVDVGRHTNLQNIGVVYARACVAGRTGAMEL